MKLRYVQSPIDPDEWLCWCGELHITQDEAAGCRHKAPRLPGVPDAVPPPRGVAAAERFVQRARWSLLAMLLWVLAVVVLLMLPWASDPAPPAGEYGRPAVTPTADPARGVMP